MPDTPFWLWAAFIVLVMVMLYVDLAIVNRNAAAISTRKALTLTAIFVATALTFAIVVYFVYERGLLHPDAKSLSGEPMTGALAVGEYLSVWMLEYSMSVDNLFVFTLIFSFFAIPAAQQHRVLFWGILGALILRGVMIGAGTAIVARFEPVLIVFGLILLWTAWKMLHSDDEQFDPEKSATFKLVKKAVPITDRLHGDKFWVRIADPKAVGKTVLHATPLFLVLCIVETTDLIFAVDSIPAAFGQSRESFIIFTANVFAILGLRSLYFAIAGLVDMFKYLKLSLAVVLGFIGVKMVLTPPLAAIGWKGFHLPTWISLTVIAVCLSGGIVASLAARKNAPTPDSDADGQSPKSK